MKKQKNQADVFIRVEQWCSNNQKALIFTILSIFTLMSMLLFNLRISEGGDDSTYIIRAVNFINDGAYPSFQGPLYPMFLSLFVSLFGIKLGVLKLSSFALMLFCLWFIYKHFKGRVPYTLLFATLLLVSVSSYFTYFSSQTYSEALFLVLQLPVIALVFKLIDNKTNTFNWKTVALLSLAIFAGYLTRTVGVGTLIAVMVFLALDKRYKEAGAILGGFIVLFGFFLIIKSSIWQIPMFDDGQASTLIYKHPYQLDKGKETIGGFITRFIDNSNLYLSKHFIKMLGLRAAGPTAVYGFITVLLYAIFAYATAKAFKKNKYLLFVAIYLMTMLGITFTALQKLWDQYRLIIPFFPFMVMTVLYGLWELSQLKKSSLLKYLFLVLIGISFIGSAKQSFTKIDLLTLRKNLKGDLYEGYTDDWRHFLSMSEYAGKKLPEQSYVAARKPNMARIYADGKKFYGIYRFDTNDPDKLLQRLKDKKVTHVIMASLRKNPRVNNGQTINTIQRYLYIISKKYPEVFKLEYQIGKIEPAFLFRVDYKAAKSIESNNQGN
ncbi:glycosyltransferase family protein [Carboxylicivirga marina]|uniref:Glycosyltransferase RgtA/B/C/D-like domain-containing protein n=1 Tax=Carboxylicivirga marina TaxID=2800988 RepID=A0ABS1HI22_9BACT|nr:hypothetical protein [Carboxylicivirga marina]MBK3517289.1 hypothetical protein [Carboxylicivirga marina]